MPGGWNLPLMTQSQYDAAPFNDPIIPEREFDVTVSQTLSKETTVWTDDYAPCVEDAFEDGVGYHDQWEDTSQTDWKKAYDATEMTPLDIINACKKLAEHLLENGTTYLGALHMKELIQSCEDWVVDDYEVNPG